MGVLDIRLRSASLGNVGGVPHIASVDQSRAAAIRNQTARMKAQSVSDGLGQLGNLVNMGVGFGAAAIAKAQAREDESKITNAANEIQKRHDAYMYGDGSEGSGAFNAQFTDWKKWIQKNGAEYDKIEGDVFGNDPTVGGMDLNDRQREAVRQRLASYKQTWAKQQALRATAYNNQRDIEGAASGVENATRTLMRDQNEQTWADWSDAVKREIEVMRRQGKITTPEGEEAVWRSRGEKLILVAEDRFIEEHNAIAMSDGYSEDANAVGELFDKAIANVESDPNPVIPDNDEVQRHLGKDAERMSNDFVVKLKKARETAMHNATARRNAKINQISFESYAASERIEAQDLSFDQKADALVAHLDEDSGFTDKDGNPMTWAEAYEKYAPQRGRSVLKSIEAYRDESERIKAAAAKGAYVNADKPATIYAPAGQEDSDWFVAMEIEILNADRDNVTTTSLLEKLEANKHRVTAPHFYSLVKELTTKRDAKNVRIRNMVFAEYFNLSPDIVEKALDKDTRNKVAPSEALTALKDKAEYDRAWRPYDPDFTVEDTLEAVEYIEDYLKQHPEDKTGAAAALKEIVKPASDAARSRTLKERILQMRSRGTWDSVEAFR